MRIPCPCLVQSLRCVLVYIVIFAVSLYCMRAGIACSNGQGSMWCIEEPEQPETTPHGTGVRWLNCCGTEQPYRCISETVQVTLLWQIYAPCFQHDELAIECIPFQSTHKRWGWYRGRALVRLLCAGENPKLSVSVCHFLWIDRRHFWCVWRVRDSQRTERRGLDLIGFACG